MKTSQIVWVIVAIIVVLAIGWFGWQYFYPAGAPSNQATENSATQNSEPTDNQPQVNNSQDLTTAEQDLDATSFAEIDASLEANSADQNSF